MTIPTDWQLLQLHRQGNRAAIETLIHRHIHMVYASASRLVSPTEADDITQTVFLILTQKAKTLPQRESLAPWLHRATQLCASNFRKQEGRHRRHIKEAAMHSPTTTTQDTPELRAQWLELLDRALLRLKEPERAVILIHHLQQQSIESTAQQLGITPEAAKKRATRALEKLRHYLTPHDQTAPAAPALAATLLAANTHAPATSIQAAIALAQGAPAAAHLTALAKATTWSLSVAPKVAAATAIAASLTIATTLTAITYAHSTPTKSAAIIPTATVPIAALPAPASKPAEVVTTAPDGPAFKGWVHMTPDTPPKPGATNVGSTNTASGASVSVEKSPQDTTITYQNPKTGEFIDYHASTNLIRIGMLNPDSADRMTEDAAKLPINFAAVVALFRPLLGDEPTGITHTIDNGLDRYDFTAPREAAKKILQTQGNSAAAADSALFDLPTVIWVDPTTHLIQKALIYDDKTETYTYGGPDITSIYDAGAPKTAKVYDNRPTPQALAILDRATKRANTPLPDGVSVTLRESEVAADIVVYGQSKNHWAEREYSVRDPKPNGYTINLPNNWATTGADEFFRRLADTASRYEENGTDSEVYFRDFTPHTAADEQTKKYADGSSLTIIYQDHYTGRRAKGSMWIASPAFGLFTLRISGHFGVDDHISLITDPQRPGLVGLRSEQHRDMSDALRGADELWLDPAHGDRPVQKIEESFEDPPADSSQSALLSSTGRFKTITDYSDYATLPDGRQYAQTSTTTDYKPRGNNEFLPTSSQKTTFHFFPNRTLPPLKIPGPTSPNLP